MLVTSKLSWICPAVALIALLGSGAAGEAAAQTRVALVEATASALTDRAPDSQRAPSADDIFLHVSVSNRRLTVYGGDRVLQRFPVGVGTGEHLSRRNGEGWRFTTPVGRFAIGRKKKDPVWYAPDWHYVEKGLPVPPAYSPERYFPGMLGDYALYLDDEIAIHGTRDEKSVGRASSHGCLRMRNEDIAIVFDLVAIGTPVIITP